MLIKTISKDAMIAPLIKDIDFNTTDPQLKSRFNEMYHDKIQKLWELFLIDMAVEKAIEQHPRLQTKLADTPLSNRSKTRLRSIDVKTVADIAIYSLSELKMIRGMGALSLKEIEDYMKEVLG